MKDRLKRWTCRLVGHRNYEEVFAERTIRFLPNKRVPINNFVREYWSDPAEEAGRVYHTGKDHSTQKTMGKEVKTVQMTAEEAAQYEAFKAEQIKKAAAEKAKKDRETYSQMVDEEIEQAIPMLRELSGDIRTVKEKVIDNFRQILDMKAEVLKRTRDGQKSHTFTNSEGNKRITIGRCVVDGWRDTVEDGIAIVKESVIGLIKDDETKALVNQIMRLIARDQAGNLKANKVLQLDKLAAELNNDRLNEGIAIIKESHIPNFSKTYVRAEYQDENGQWRYIPLGMTEA